MHHSKIQLIFLCTKNSCRSQMAEGWVNHLKKDRIEVYSAGTDSGGIDPRAIKVMAEVGVDISEQFAKNVNDIIGIEFDYVITLCDSAQQACPVFAHQPTTLHRGFEDPPKLARDITDRERALEPYRKVRDEIHQWVQGMPENLGTGQRGPAD